MTISQKISQYFFDYIRPPDIRHLDSVYTTLVDKVKKYFFRNAASFGAESLDSTTVGELHDYIDDRVNGSFSEYASGLNKSLAAFAVTFLALAYEQADSSALDGVVNFILSMDVSSSLKVLKEIASFIVTENKGVLFPMAAFSMLSSFKYFSNLSEMKSIKENSHAAAKLVEQY